MEVTVSRGGGGIAKGGRLQGGGGRGAGGGGGWWWMCFRSLLCIILWVTPTVANYLVTQVKTKISNIWPKINTLTENFTYLTWVKGFPVQITPPTGCPTGLGVIFTRGLVGWSYLCGGKKLLKWLSALSFPFNFWINI